MNGDWTEVDFVKYAKNLENKLCNTSIPDYMHETVIEYIMTGRNTGSFLQAVLTNDLNAAVRRGDDYNQSALVDYVKFLHNHAPQVCFGDDVAVTEWKKIGGFRGLMTKGVKG